MLEKRVTTTGKIFASASSLQVWEKNPRFIENKEDFERLKRQIKELGQYKPLLVTEDGIVVGGNMRLRAMTEMGTDDVWITELSFGKEEQTPEQIANGEPQKYRALIDGKVQEKVADSIEQIMLEYALSDNDNVGMYNQQELAELMQPYQTLMPVDNYKLELAPSVKLQTFSDQFHDKVPGLSDADKNDEKKSKFIIVKMQYTPDQFAEVEPRIEKLKAVLGIENMTDLFNQFLNMAEEKLSSEVDDTQVDEQPASDTTVNPEPALTPAPEGSEIVAETQTDQSAQNGDTVQVTSEVTAKLEDEGGSQDGQPTV